MNGDECMSYTRVYKWHNRLKQGQDEIEDDPRAWHPSTSNTDENIGKIDNLICQGDTHRLSILHRLLPRL